MRKDCDTCIRDEFGDYCKHCEWSAGKAPSKWKPVEWWTPDTNADRIRAMSDEELAEFLCGVYDDENCGVYQDECGKFINGTIIFDYDQYKIAEWLKQPAEE